MWQAAPAPGKKPKRRFPLWVVGVFVVVALFSIFSNDESKAHPQRGEYASRIKGVSASDLGRQSWASGKPSVLMVFATWCPHCKAMFADMIRLYEKTDKTNVAFLYVSTDRERDALANFLAHRQSPASLTFLHLSQEELEHFAMIAGRQNLQFQGGIPYIAVFGGDGALVREFLGRVPLRDVEKAVKAAGG